MYIIVHNLVTLASQSSFFPPISAYISSILLILVSGTLRAMYTVLMRQTPENNQKTVWRPAAVARGWKKRSSMDTRAQANDMTIDVTVPRNWKKIIFFGSQ